MGVSLNMINTQECSDRLLKDKLLRANNKFLTMFQLSPVGMAIVDATTGDFLEVNDSVLNSAGYTKDEFIQLSYWDITPKEYEKQELQQIEDLKRTGRFGPNQKEYIRKDGTRYPITISGVALTDIDGKEIVLGIIEDISERKAHERKLEHDALYDPLTNLPNRRLLFNNLHQSLAHCKREQKKLALLLLDIDNFKPVNDSLGHKSGDELLISVSQRLQGLIQRETDTVARLGGDEFVIMLPLITNDHDATLFAKKVMDCFLEPVLVGQEYIDISVSIGISIFPEHGDDELTLIENADKAMYQVKNEHRNNYKIFMPLR
ncbi:sensor domain-containing diguanylate cyclase [Vibrio cortegadensis]|uniref:sensor domain-containing diguanylate cyclase n=1 Tax=Vibrio cortegadensis TaxID=1328770 RepID=UPI0021C49731|nr:sensor domain-containing diguanylate cyclase [Vibrio cortegadensis]